jgi:hypothetical protein
MLPTLQGGPVELRGLSGKEGDVTGPEVTEEGKIPPVPVAPDESLFTPLFPPQQLPEPPPPPPTGG